MTRLVAIVLCLTVALSGALPAADAATKGKAKRVCVVKKVRTKSGRKVRKKVCRTVKPAKRKPAAKAPAAAPAPAPVVFPAPASPAAPAPTAPAATPAAPGTPAAPTRACEPEASNRLLATARDLNGRFVLSLSRTCLLAGRTIVQLNNTDLQNHDLWVEGAGQAAREVVDVAAPGATEERNLDLTAGTWRLFCSIEGHANMSRTITVVD